MMALQQQSPGPAGATTSSQAQAFLAGHLSAAKAAAQASAGGGQGSSDPVSYERLRDAFIRELQHFHETRG